MILSETLVKRTRFTSPSIELSSTSSPTFAAALLTDVQASGALCMPPRKPQASQPEERQVEEASS